MHSLELQWIGTDPTPQTPRATVTDWWFTISPLDGCARRPDRTAVMVPALAAGAVAAYVMHVVAQHTVEIVRAKRLLPRWDLATHLGHGWLDYHLLVTGQVHRLLWDLWQQAYWPPGLSIFQLPFYLVLGGDMTSGLWSTPAAFVLLVVTGTAILLRERARAGLAAASAFVALLISSPFLLAYASVTMTEMLGALAQLVVLFCYQGWRLRQDERSATALAMSLTALFFVKYNYFLLLVVPLLLFEWLDATSEWTLSQRLAQLRAWGRRVLQSPIALLLVVYAVALLVIVFSGGFQFHLLGQRVSVRSVGSSGHVVLYTILLRLAYLHRRGRIPWQRAIQSDVRVRPLLLWFGLPVTLWLASPYPNHLRDVANLVINRPVGEPTVESGLVSYVEMLRSAYFYNGWVLALVAAGFMMAAARYRQQSPLMRLLILAVPLQLVAIALHQTRFPRFLLLTVVLLCLAATAEAGRLFAHLRAPRISAVVVSAVLLLLGMSAAQRIVAQERFTAVAFEHYTDSDLLRRVLDEIREALTPDARLLIVGQNNDLSPALFRWELGPPSGMRDFPYPLGGAGRLNPELATHLLLLAPIDPRRPTLDPPAYDPARFRELMADVERGAFELRHEWHLDDLGVVMRLYRHPNTSQ